MLVVLTDEGNHIRNEWKFIVSYLLSGDIYHDNRNIKDMRMKYVSINI